MDVNLVPDVNGVPDVADEIASMLLAWRTKVLNALLTTTAIAALPAIWSAVSSAFRDPSQWPAALAFLVFYLFVAGLAAFRRLDARLRAWGFLMVGQAVAILATARGGLAGDGRVYFIAMPILAMVIVGGGSGLLMAIISLVSYTAFAILAHQGLLEKWLVSLENSVVLGDWVAAGTAMVLVLVLVMVLLWNFHRFQVQTMKAERRSSLELVQARGLLEEYNQTLEHKVQQRTAELQESIVEREQLQQQVIDGQQQVIQRLSTPIIPMMDRIIVMPLVGNVDSVRARDITRGLLAGIQEHRAKVVLLDITGVSIVDSEVVNHLNKTIQAARLKGAHTILTGISDAVAETIVDLGIDWSSVETLGNLQTGLRTALAKMGRRIEG